MSAPFPYSAGLGDMITGVIAARLGLGLASAEGSPVQLLHFGVGSEAMQHLPYSLVPTVLVPFYLITHGIVAAQLAARPDVLFPAVHVERFRVAR